MGSSPFLAEIQRRAVALRREAVEIMACGKSLEPHALVWVRLFSYVYIQTYNWKSH